MSNDVAFEKRARTDLILHFQWESDKISNAHTIGCNAVSWAPFNASGVKRFVSGGCDNLVKLWRFDDGAGRFVEEAKLEAHSDWVRDVAWAPALGANKSVIASCSQVSHALWT